MTSLELYVLIDILNRWYIQYTRLSYYFNAELYIRGTTRDKRILNGIYEEIQIESSGVPMVWRWCG